MHRDLAEAILRSPRTQQALMEILRQLPDDVAPELAALRVLEVLSATSVFIEAAKTFPPSVIAAVLERIPRANPLDATAIFLAEVTRASAVDEVRDAWARGLEALAALGAYEALDEKKRRSRARVLVKDVAFLGAVQAAVASRANDQTRGMVELLAAEGSEASVDALMIELGRAEALGAVRLRQLAYSLEMGARTPRIAEMLEALRLRHRIL